VDGYGLSRPRAGVGVYTREVLHAMAVDRPDCRFTVYVPEGVTDQATGPAFAIRKLPPTRFVGRHLQWPSRLRTLKPDAYFGPAGLLPLRSLGCPSVITVHDLAIYRNPGWFPSRQLLSTRLVVPRSLERATAIVASSTNTANDLQELFDVPKNRIEMVLLGVSSRFRPLSAQERAEARAKLGLPDRYILFMSTIEPRKNLATLLEAWAMMRDRPDLVIAGAWGWGDDRIKDQIERLGSGVHVLGEVEPSDQVAIYNLALVLAHPAWYEGFGMSPLEAMACGTPVVVSENSSLPEVVGDAGLLVPPDDPDAWREALEKVLADIELAAGLRRRGLLRAAELTWVRTANYTWRVIDKAIRAEAA
jgi:glycosyltransferase involved in cell wall biosynthesis